MRQSENILPAYKNFTISLCHFFSILSSFLSHLKCPSVPLRRGEAPVHSLCWERTKELVDCGLPYRHTQEALLKPRLNPTLLCLTLHTSTQSKTSLISWILCSSWTPQRQREHCTGQCSNPGGATMSRGEMLLCFCSEYPKERRTIGHLKLVWPGSEIISPYYVLLEVVFRRQSSCNPWGAFIMVTFPAVICLLMRNCNRNLWNPFVAALFHVSQKISFGHMAS